MPQPAEAPFDLDLLVAQMCSAVGYPAMAPAIVSGEIVAPVFWLLARHLRPVLALARVQMMRSVGIGAALALAGDKAQPMAEREIREAYPRG